MGMINITWLLIGLTAIVSIQAFQNSAMQSKLIFHPYSIRQRGEYYRFLTHGFIHASWEHLLVNMYVLLIFGEYLENTFQAIFPNFLGPFIFVLLYLTGIVLSSIPSYIKHADNPQYAALGASGATSALVFAIILFNPWEWFIFPPLPALIFGIAYLWYSNYMSNRNLDNIGHDAHFWGAVYGLVFTLASVYYFQPSVIRYFLDRLLEGPSLPGIFS